jgi:hypothetical protein
VHKLINAIQPLYDYRTSLRVFMISIKMTQSSLELMSKCKPIFFNQHLESSNSSVIWIKHQLNQSAQLCSSIPPISAVHKYIYLLNFHCFKYPVSTWKYFVNDMQPSRWINGRQELGVEIISIIDLCNVMNFSHSISHSMDVVNV